MLIKRIISTAAILGVMAAFAVAGSPVFAADNKPVEVTVYGNYDNPAPAEDKLIPGPDPVDTSLHALAGHDPVRRVFDPTRETGQRTVH